MKGDLWCKFHVKAIWSPSLRKLTATQRWVWTTLLALATEGDGMIHGAASEPSHIALASDTDARGVPDALAKMQHLCLINVRKNGDIKIRNWPKYQSTTAERRDRKGRQIGGEKPAKPRQPAAPEVEVDKSIEVDKILTTWRTIKPKAQLTEGVKKAVNARLKNYTVDEICQAIKNYAGCTDTFWVEFKAKGGWNLQQFLSRGEGEAGLGRFLTASSQYRRGLVCRWAKPPNDCATLTSWDKSGDHPCNTCERYEP